MQALRTAQNKNLGSDYNYNEKSGEELTQSNTKVFNISGERFEDVLGNVLLP